MPTSKSRINITAEPGLEAALRRAAKRERVPVASKAAELLRLGLELEEDLYFAKLAERREKTHKGRYLTHEEVWGK